MRLLVDTHLLIWWLTDNPRMSIRARKLIADPVNTVFVSAVTLWEIRLKQSVDKLQLPPDFDDRLAASSFENLPLIAAHTKEITAMDWHHRDPFDRMLVAQSKVEKITLLTADANVARYGKNVLLVA